MKVRWQVSRGAILTRESEEALWQTFFAAAPAQRREFEPSSRPFLAARNFAKHLKAFRWKTPPFRLSAAWTKDPSVFITNPRHLVPGPNTDSSQWH
jgi:hypothetical protein